MHKEVIGVIWKDDRELEVFKSLKAFIRKYPDFSEDSINNSLSREKKPYDTSVVRIERKPIQR